MMNGDECVKMESIMSDTTMIQIKAEEYDCVRKVEEFLHKKKSRKQSQKSKPPSPCWLCVDFHFARNCPFRYHICNICRKKDIRKLNARVELKVPRGTK